MAKNSLDNCPVCDNNLTEEQDECPNCGAILELFDIEGDIDGSVSKDAVEKVRNLIIEEGEDEELIEEFRGMEFSSIMSGDDEENFEEIVTFACPICDSEVDENDSQCPNCGAIFEEEGDKEIFEDETKQEKRDPFTEKEEIIVDFQDEIEKYQRKIERFESSGLGTKYLKKDLDELKEAQNNKEKEKGKEILEEIDVKIKYAENIMEITSKCESLLRALAEKIDTSEMEKKVEKIYDGCDIGEYEVASKRAQNIQKEIIEKINRLDEEKGLGDLIEEKSEEAREIISNIKADVDPKRVEEKIDDALSTKNDGNIERGVYKVMKALDLAVDISEISEKIVEANEYIEKISQKGMNSSLYQENIDEAINKIESEGKETAFEIVNESIEDMQNKLEKYEKEETKKLESLELDEEIQEKIPQLESLLSQADKFGIDIKEGNEKIGEAVKYADEDDYEKGLTNLEEIESKYREKLDKKIDEKIDSIKEEESENLLKKEGDFDKIEKLKEKGDYEKILDMIEEVKEKIENQKEIKEDLSEDILKIEKIADYSENLDFEIKNVKSLIEDAKEKIENEEWSEAKKDIKICQNKVKKKLLDFLKGEITIAKKKLSGIENGDVTKPIGFLKEANQARKEDKIEESFKALNNYKEEMDRIFENDN